MLETKEVLLLWLAGTGKKTIAARLGLDPKTVRKYVRVAQDQGLSPDQGEVALTVEKLTGILAALKDAPGRDRGETWAQCERHRMFIQRHLENRLRLTKVRKLLKRQGVEIPYGTLYRFAIAELGFGKAKATVPVADGAPGAELQLDTGWVGSLEPDPQGKRRRFRAFIFTPALSRYRFVYPIFHETTAMAIEACEAAWQFYGGSFQVLIPDNTKAIVLEADPLHPRLVPTFLEYSQARGFHVDPARVRHPQDKARVERIVPTVRDDCFAGENLPTLDGAREHGEHWCLSDYGMRRHSTTGRLPREHFEADERAALRPVPSHPYDIPIWAHPKVARDHFAQVARALYSLPTRFIGKTLTARADSALVRFYDGTTLVKTHPRKGPGERSTDTSDFPPEKAACARRDIAFLAGQAETQGEAIGRFARALLEGPLPWTRMRRVYALLGLVRRYGGTRVNTACERALANDMMNLKRLERMIQLGLELPDPAAPQNPALPPARFLRPVSQYALSTSLNSKGDLS